MQNSILEVQKKMNSALTRKNYKLAYSFFKTMNELRAENGMPYFSMPNLEKRFANA